MFVALLTAGAALGQVSICYDFEDATPNSRPMGWGALPNLDFHYVGVISGVAHSGSNSLCNNGTTCYTIMPDEGINYGADSVWLTFWYYLHNNTDYFDVGYINDATDSTTFHRLATVHDWANGWRFYAVDLSPVPTGARIAFFGHDLFSSDGTFWLDDVYLTDAPCWLWGIHVAEITSDSVQLEWHKAGNPGFSVGWGDHTYYPADTSITLPRVPYFSNVIPYEITYCSLPSYYSCPCRPGVQGVYNNIRVLPYREASCVRVEDDFSTAAIPYTGTPVEPYLSASTRTTTTPGITGIYAGSHTLNTNPGNDNGGAGMMVFWRTIPPGDNVTMRLGNRMGDWESASMLYTITVDTNEANLLVMKYTMAMAFGSMNTTPIVAHNDTLHPAWFCIEMMDDTMGGLQPEGCNRFYIDMWDTAGWDEMNSMYKRRDFTGMAFDLAPYHGQRLHLRVTATDGVVNNRWCYAYYNLECLKRHDYSDGCSDGDSVTFTMPYGFRYRWWRGSDTTTIDNRQSITVATDSTLYHCELINRFDTGCSFTVSRWALPRPQRWENDTVVENALPYTWREITFSTAGDTSITLPSSTGDCDTSLHFHLHVWPNQQSRIERMVCPDEWPFTWQGHTFSGPDSVTVTLTDCHGADSTVTLVTYEAQAYELYDTIVICPGSSFVYDGTDYDGPTVVDTLLTTVQGCDSLLHIALIPRDSIFSLHALHSTDGLHWADTVPIVLCSNQTLHTVDSTQGSAAWQWTLDSSGQAATQLAQFTFDTADSVALHTLSLAVTSQDGCTDTLRWPVVVFPSPAAEFIWTPEHPADIAPEVQLINYSQPTDCQWLWLMQCEPDGAYCDSLTAFEPIYRWQGDISQGDYDVQLVALRTMQFDSMTHTCSDTARHSIGIVTAWLDFPNLVTPNGDGINDRWEVVNLVDMGLYPMNELWIFNQWGIQVFHARNITSHEQFWDPNERPCPDGTYYYRFIARSAFGTVRRNGIIEVLR